MPEKGTKTSAPPLSGAMKPKPFSLLNHFTVPCAITELPHGIAAVRPVRSRWVDAFRPVSEWKSSFARQAPARHDVKELLTSGPTVADQTGSHRPRQRLNVIGSIGAALTGARRSDVTTRRDRRSGHAAALASAN